MSRVPYFVESTEGIRRIMLLFSEKNRMFQQLIFMLCSLVLSTGFLGES